MVSDREDSRRSKKGRRGIVKSTGMSKRSKTSRPLPAGGLSNFILNRHGVSGPFGLIQLPYTQLSEVEFRRDTLTSFNGLKRVGVLVMDI